MFTRRLKREGCKDEEEKSRNIQNVVGCRGRGKDINNDNNNNNNNL